MLPGQMRRKKEELMSLHDVTKNLQPAPVPVANPWCDASKKLSSTKKLNSSRVVSSSGKDELRIAIVENPKPRQEKPLFDFGKQKGKESVKAAVGDNIEIKIEAIDTTVDSNDKTTTYLNENGILNQGHHHANYNKSKKNTQKYVENELENAEGKLKETTNSFQLLQLNSKQIGGVSVNNADNHNINSNNNYNENRNNHYPTYQKKTRHSFSNNNRNYSPGVPPIPLPMGFGQPFYPGMYQNNNGSNTSKPVSPDNNSNSSNAFLSNRRMSMPQYDRAMLPNRHYYPYMCNGFYPPMPDHLGMQQMPLPSRVYYGQQFNETNIHDMRVPVPMVLPNGVTNGVPIPISPQLPVYNQQYGSIRGNVPFPNMNSPVSHVVEDERLNQLIYQIRYYFSVENLCKDMYLRRQMDEKGFIPISLIKGFSRVRTLSQGVPSVVDYVIDHIDIIEKREFDDSDDYKIRLREGWEKWLLTRS
ncbi:hypothetical protein PMKS-001780 [Pichia membranifaciens]|uniref:HTH La-type RNA-binding domain-containing protein n=1 Tax=Pichia membranifaciens TaxID=4926 RepID=A0A1Q2YFJ8_9ASCO|nr:hypothetical protein PMKS-001780 [Pichia membranifaciens]